MKKDPVLPAGSTPYPDPTKTILELVSIPPAGRVSVLGPWIITSIFVLFWDALPEIIGFDLKLVVLSKFPDTPLVL